MWLGGFRRDGDLGAVLGGSQCDLLADATTRACNENRLTFEVWGIVAHESPLD